MVVTTAVAHVLDLVEDSGQVRPLSVLLGVVVAVAVLVGSYAAIAAAATSVVLGWWKFIADEHSFRFAEASDVGGLALYVATVVPVVYLVTQLERARRDVDRERAVWERLFRESPVGIALIDQGRRTERMNPHLGALDDGSGAAATTLQPLVRAVTDSGKGLPARTLAVDVRGRGEAHWSVSAFPVEVDGQVLVGATVQDVTAEIVRGRRSELLLDVSRAFNSAITVSDAEHAVAPMVAAALAARVVIVHVEGDRLEVACEAGYDGEPWAGVALDARAGGPAARCVAEGQPVLALAQDGDEAVLRRRVGDRTVLWQPVLLPGSTTVAGAFSVAWDFDRPVTDDSRLLLETIAALAGASIARIGLAEDIAGDRFRHAMDAMIDQVTLAHAIRDDAGQIVDFEIDFVNGASRDGAGRAATHLVGQRVCDLYPGWRESGMFDRFVQVVETGEPIVEDRVRYVDRLPDGTEIAGHWTLQVVRVDDGYIAASRDVSEVVAAEQALAATERARERERVAVDLLQEVALPGELPATAWLEVGAHYRPARKDAPIGGDWYDAFALDEDRVCVLIADVSGHGPEAAAFMVQVRNITRSVIAEVIDPGRALGRVNRILHQLGQAGGPFVTVCLGVVDASTATLTWALAGHPPPILTRRGSSEPLVGVVGPPLAVFRDVDWSSMSVPLEPGDRLTLCTDGLIERRSEVIDVGIDRLCAATASLAARSAAEAADELASQVQDPGDDLAVLCAWYR